MLIDGLLHILNGVLTWFIGSRPPWQLTLDSGPSTLIGQALYWDWCFPIHELLADFALLLELTLALIVLKWSVKLVDWIADVIP